MSEKTKKSINREQFSRLIDGPERIRESCQVSHPITGPPDGITRTVYDVLRRSAQLHPDAPLFGENVNGKYNWTTYQDAINDAKWIGSGIMKIRKDLGSCQQLIGIAGIHSRNYMHCLHGIISYNMTIVPLYHNSKLKTLIEIIDHCQLEIIFCDTFQRAEAFISSKNESNALQSVKMLIVLNNDAPNNSDFIVNIDKVKEIGQHHLCDEMKPSPKTIYVICHTSGTTGRPKGVEMSHGALLAAVSGIFTSWTICHNWKFDTNDTYFSFLSLAHIYEHLMQTLMIYFGGRVGIYNGDVSSLVPQIQLLRPTLVSLVPRLLNKLYENVHNGVAKKNILSRKLFEFAKKKKAQQLEQGILRYDTIWDKIVFKKLKQLLGGNIRVLTTGGAPVTKEVKTFTRYAYGCPLIEGYGQTECSAAGTLTLPWDTTYGNVGGPAPWSQVKLIDAPENDYLAHRDEGEVCFRGAALMTGYFRDETLTAKTIDSDGWLHTGDIGRWLPNGSLQIIDRKNEMFKLSQGDFVSPIQIESIYSNSPFITQIYVTGRTERSFLVGIVVLDQTRSKHLIQKDGKLTDKDVQDPKIRTIILQELNKYGKEKGLQTIELIRNVYLTTQEFTEENGLVTSTLKNRRKILEHHFSDQINQMYNEIQSL